MIAGFPYLPADLLPGILDGWCGPVEWRDDASNRWTGGALIGPSGGEWSVSMAFPEPPLWRHGAWIRLDIRRREVQHLVRDYLEAGAKCPNCAGLGRVSQGGAGPFPCLRCGGMDDGRAMHNGSGYRIPPSRLRWTLDLPPWEAAVALWLSAVRVAAGMGAIRGISDVSGPAEYHLTAEAPADHILRDGSDLHGLCRDGLVTFARSEAPDAR